MNATHRLTSWPRSAAVTNYEQLMFRAGDLLVLVAAKLASQNHFWCLPSLSRLLPRIYTIYLPGLGDSERCLDLEGAEFGVYQTNTVHFICFSQKFFEAIRTSPFTLARNESSARRLEQLPMIHHRKMAKSCMSRTMATVYRTTRNSHSCETDKPLSADSKISLPNGSEEFSDGQTSFFCRLRTFPQCGWPLEANVQTAVCGRRWRC